ncbi:MAG: redoxin domain-containing protein [Bacteroidales bacterium]|nr:redoxin domain-containing protein [Bacteroidales bacterium]
MRTSIYLALIVVIACACSGRKTNFDVEVRVSNSQGSLIHLARRTLTGTVMIDSAMPDKSGTYKLKGFTPQPDFFILYTHPNRYINLIIRPGDDFRVLTSEESFDVNYLVEGSKDSRLIQKMVTRQTRTLEKITEISTLYERSMGRKDFEIIKAGIDSTYDKVFAEHKQFSIELIRDNPGSLASLMALYQQLGRNAPVFDYKKDFSYYELVDSGLSKIYPNSEAVIDLNRKVSELRNRLKLEIGSTAPEISLPDSAGKTVALASLRNKKVLIIFWATWSSQSVAELERFALLYPQAEKKNLEYFMISLDRTRESWLKGIEGKGFRGIHASDLKYWDSPVVARYKIEQLPVVYLLNEEGVIINRNFTAGDFSAILHAFGN